MISILFDTVSLLSRVHSFAICLFDMHFFSVSLEQILEGALVSGQFLDRTTQYECFKMDICT